MTFSSLAFLFVFFPVVFLLYCVCRNNLIRNILLIIASLLFYGYGEPIAVFIMLISILFNYLLGLLCGREEGTSEAVRTIALAAAVVLNIGLLFVFKYADFFLRSVGLGRFALNIALPIGISFFTFQGLSYVIDVYRDRECVQKNPLSVMLYISFFPQLIAGPIVKYHDIREQLSQREFSAERIANGLQRFIFGLSKKVLIAGPMGLMADAVFGLDMSGIGAATAWIAGISYMMQIYFDFSGYSDMAIGLGCIFGFDFKENFDKPYTAGNMQIFWRKWHISLSTWFKEYVYIPLGGNRKGKIRTYVNKFIVFMLTGLWHGANWTFIFWGIMHGIALIAEDITKTMRMKVQEFRLRRVGYNAEHNYNDEGRQIVKSNYLKDVICKIAGHAYVIFFTMVAFIIFRADTLTYGVKMIGRLFAGSGSNALAFSLLTPQYLIALAAAVILSTTLPDKIMSVSKTWILRVLSVLVYLVSLAMLVAGGYNPFIYFRF